MELLGEVCIDILESMSDVVIVVDKNEKIVRLNILAEEMLNLKAEDYIGKKISDIIVNGQSMKIVRIKKNEDKDIEEHLSINGKHFKMSKLPITTNGIVKGYLNILKDITDYKKMSMKIHEDELYIDVLNTILDTVNEWVVVVDSKGIITMLSKRYKEFVNDMNPEGKHVTEVIENTRMHIVAQTGIKEIGDIQEIKGNKMIAMRIPIKKNGKVIGAVGKVMFKDISNFHVLGKKISNLEKEIEYYRSELGKERRAKYSIKDIIGDSAKIMVVKDLSRMVAKTDSNVLIMGESGTGKELFAHAIHNYSDRFDKPFVKLNCAAIPSDLLESELFGYEEGAFTGAKRKGNKGKFEIADGGTILLDEIGDMSFNMQAKLLRVIQEKEIERLGSSKVQKVDVRIIASTNKDLEKLIKKGEFRQDLYYRLNVMMLNVPPLRERREDIESLAKSLTNKIANKFGKYVEGISSDAMRYLVNYNWPGNVRELENVIERAINLLDTNLIIKPIHLPLRLMNDSSKSNFKENVFLKEIIEDVEKEAILRCLEKNNWNKKRSAQELGISRTILYRKIEKYNLEKL